MSAAAEKNKIRAMDCHPGEPFLYGYDQLTDCMVRMTTDGSVTLLPRPDGLPPDAYDAGAFDSSGIYYLYTSGQTAFYAIDLRPDSPSFLQLVDPARSLARQTAAYGTILSAPIQISSWNYHPFDRCLYGTGHDGTITQINPATGLVRCLSQDCSGTASGWDPPIPSDSDRSWNPLISSGSTCGWPPPVSSSPPSADLSITQTADPSPAAPGKPITYRITVNNSGPSDAMDVLLSDELPDDITDRQFSLDKGRSWLPWQGNCTIGTLANGETRTLLIWGMVSDDAADPLIHKVAVTSSTQDPKLSDNAAVIDTAVTTIADLSLHKVACPSAATPGQPICCTLEIRNQGPQDAYHVVLTDILPPSLCCARFSLDNGCTWRPWNGSFCFNRKLRAGECFTVLISAVVREDADRCTEHTATVTSGVYDPNSADNAVTVCVYVDHDCPSCCQL